MKSPPNKKSDTIPEEYDVLPDDLLHVIARLKGRAAPEKGVPVATSILYPVSAAIAAEERRKGEEIIAIINGSRDYSAFIGQEIPGHGIYIGTWQPQDLSQKFNVFAAPEDLTDKSNNKAAFKYADVLQRIASLTSWYGHRGTNYITDKDLYEALRDGSYIKEGSGWFIPPRELLTGTETDNPLRTREDIIQPDNLYDLKDKGLLSGTFCNVATEGMDVFRWYWSSTEHCNQSSDMWFTDFRDGLDSNTPKDLMRLSCRPVRLELVP